MSSTCCWVKLTPGFPCATNVFASSFQHRRERVAVEVCVHLTTQARRSGTCAACEKVTAVRSKLRVG